MAAVRILSGPSRFDIGYWGYWANKPSYEVRLMTQVGMETSQAVAGRANILIVDDDALFRESLARNLAHSNFVVEEVGDGQQALDRLQNGTLPDLVLLDWKMPGMNGIEVLDHLHQTQILVPVLFLTVLSDQMYEEAALQVGAIDFVEKHRAFAILLKRIELILAGTKARAPTAWDQPGNGSLRVGSLELRFDINRALWRGQRVDLSLTEFHIVSRLASAAGADVGHRELYDVVKREGFLAGHGNEGYRANVRTTIKRVRKKFRAADSTFGQIETYNGFGYRWKKSEPMAV
jgi:two-component system response regulator ChvI